MRIKRRIFTQRKQYKTTTKSIELRQEIEQRKHRPYGNLGEIKRERLEKTDRYI